MTFTVTYRAKDGALREERIEAARRRFPQRCGTMGGGGRPDRHGNYGRCMVVGDTTR